MSRSTEPGCLVGPGAARCSVGRFRITVPADAFYPAPAGGRRLVIFVLGAVLVAVGVVAAMSWQHVRYHRARRRAVQDLQAPLYSRSAFHVLTFVRLADGQDAIEALGKLRSDVEAGGSAKLVYAGRIATVPLKSSQLPDTDWDAVILVQYPSRDAYAAAARSSSLQSARARFADSFSQGFDRPVLRNLAVPQLLLALRTWQLVTRQPSLYPLTPAPANERDPRTAQAGEVMALFDSLRPLGNDAVVVVNLLKGGTAEQRAADRSYGLKMAGGFAEGGHGPMHIGRAVRVEGEAEFDTVVLMYYPGIDYFTELMGSTFFQRIVSDKQPGDTLAAPSVPVLALL